MSIETDPTILREAFLYFAKFADHNEVMKLFNRRGSKYQSEYDEIKASLIALDSASMVPGIDAIIFASSEDAIKRQIEDFKGDMFLFTDYGQISSEQDNMKRKNDGFDIGLTVASKQDPEKMNSIEAIIQADKTLNALRSLRSTMITDDKCHPFVKRLSFPQDIIPFYARDWSHATGWSMMFKWKGIDIL